MAQSDLGELSERRVGEAPHWADRRIDIDGVSEVCRLHHVAFHGLVSGRADSKHMVCYLMPRVG